MTSRTLTLAAALTAALAGAPALAQSEDRPDEDALFGGQEETPAAAPATSSEDAAERDDDALFGGDGAEARPASTDPTERQPTLSDSDTGDDRDADVLNGPASRSAFDTEEVLDDPLKIGGQFYVRGFMAGSENTPLRNTSFSAPTLVDGFFDARPSDRLRGYIVGRLSYDPAQPPGTAPNALSNPRVLLDQAWLRFDIARTLFFTVGKQHVKWGTGQIWNPTDFLSPQRRDPLAFVDLRTGVSMVKMHLPWESKGWNLYGVVVMDDLGTDVGAVTDPSGSPTSQAGGNNPVNRLGRLGGALRAEVLLGPAELGASAVAQNGRRPRFGLDVSSPLGPLDIYSEVALKKRTDRPLYRIPAGTTLEDIAQGGVQVESYVPEGLTPQVTAGATYSFSYGDNDLAVLGVEYLYNSTGYTSSFGYPYLLLKDAFNPLYLGRHYGAAYVFLDRPGSLERTSFNLFTLGNLSDRSFTTRLNVIHRALTYLTVEAYGSMSYGRRGGEFRLGFDVPEGLVVDGQPIPAFNVPAPTFQLGAGLRLNL